LPVIVFNGGVYFTWVRYPSFSIALGGCIGISFGLNGILDEIGAESAVQWLEGVGLDLDIPFADICLGYDSSENVMVLSLSIDFPDLVFAKLSWDVEFQTNFVDCFHLAKGELAAEYIGFCDYIIPCWNTAFDATFNDDSGCGADSGEGELRMPTYCQNFTGYITTPDMDHIGDDIENVGFSNSTAAICDTTPSCQGFNSDGNLKSNVSSPVTSIGKCLYTSIYTICPPVPGFAVYPDADHPGDNSFPFNIDNGFNASSAATFCEAFPGCAGFSSLGTLKTAANPTTTYPGACLYQRNSAQCQQFSGYLTMTNMDSMYNDIYQADDLNEAETNCSSNPICAGFNSQFYVKSSISANQTSYGMCLYARLPT
ncbi:hypothetical protein Vretimale_19771, partial [Volvox reticuliferus]